MSGTTVGIIGLGAMGAPMAGRLLDAGVDVVSCANRNRDTIERLATKGLRELDDPKAIGAKADLLLSVVFDEDQTDTVLRGSDGALATMRSDTVALIMSTVSPDYCRALSTEAAERGVTVLDCPLSGMPTGARDGTLTLMLGGDEKAIAHHADTLEVLGTIAPCGEIGMGQVMKVANNAMAIGTWAMLMEVRDAVAGHGMDLDRFMSILNQSSGRSFVSEHFPFPPNRVPLPAMAIKDLSICLHLAAAASQDVPIVERVLESGTPEGSM